MRFEVLVEVRLRPGIADPQGQTIERALPALGFPGVSEVRTGKAIRLAVEAADEAGARVTAEELCQRFLANPVIEEALVTVDRHRDGGGDGGGGGADGGGVGGGGGAGGGRGAGGGSPVDPDPVGPGGPGAGGRP